MVVHNPNNWYVLLFANHLKQKNPSLLLTFLPRHWIDKNCLPWSKEYFQVNIIDTTYEDEQYKFQITSIDSVSGDCDVTQRKGKVLCIYDMKLKFSLSGNIKKDGESESEKITATIVIPEFVHDQDEDEYVFEIDSNDNKAEIRKFFIPVLRTKLMKFQPDLLEAHAKDVQHATD
ncbi:Hsp90 co-chaperone AHA1 [Candida tropicalis]